MSYGGGEGCVRKMVVNDQAIESLPSFRAAGWLSLINHFRSSLSVCH